MKDLDIKKLAKQNPRLAHWLAAYEASGKITCRDNKLYLWDKGLVDRWIILEALEHRFKGDYRFKPDFFADGNSIELVSVRDIGRKSAKPLIELPHSSNRTVYQCPVCDTIVRTPLFRRI